MEYNNISAKKAKQYAIAFIRNKKISQVDFLNILDYLKIDKYKRISEIFAIWNSTQDEAVNFYKKLFLAIDLKQFESSPFLLMENENHFYSLLPNDADLLLSAMYYFLLEPKKKNVYLMDCMAHLMRVYHDFLFDDEKDRKETQDLLETYTLLTTYRKKQVLDFVNFLFYKQEDVI